MNRTTQIIATFLLAGAIAAAADVNTGKVAYDKACKSCHGATGTPNPAIAKSLKVDMRDLGSKEVQSLSDAEIRTIITDGKGKMRPIKTVSGPDVDNVIAYVRTLKK